MKHVPRIAFAAALCCSASNLIIGVNADPDHGKQDDADPRLTQMKYGEQLTRTITVSETDSAGRGDVEWPTSDVPGMNIYDM
jgi:hypothetical protein